MYKILYCLTHTTTINRNIYTIAQRHIREIPRHKNWSLGSPKPPKFLNTFFLIASLPPITTSVGNRNSSEFSISALYLSKAFCGWHSLLVWWTPLKQSINNKSFRRLQIQITKTYYYCKAVVDCIGCTWTNHSSGNVHVLKSTCVIALKNKLLEDP